MRLTGCWTSRCIRASPKTGGSTSLQASRAKTAAGDDLARGTFDGTALTEVKVCSSPSPGARHRGAAARIAFGRDGMLYNTGSNGEKVTEGRHHDHKGKSCRCDDGTCRRTIIRRQERIPAADLYLRSSHSLGRSSIRSRVRLWNRDGPNGGDEINSSRLAGTTGGGRQHGRSSRTMAGKLEQEGMKARSSLVPRSRYPA